MWLGSVAWEEGARLVRMGLVGCLLLCFLSGWLVLESGLRVVVVGG